jgi:hypothetical protein
MAMTHISIDALSLWPMVGTIIGLLLLAVYRFIIRYDYALIPLATSSFTILHVLQQGIFNAYPGAAFETGINISGIIIIASLWYWHINRNNQ